MYHIHVIRKANKKILVLSVTGFNKIGSVGRDKFFLETVFIHRVELRASKSVHTYFKLCN